MGNENMQAAVKKMPSLEEVKHEMIRLPDFDDYLVHPKLGKIWSQKVQKWLLVDAVGVGDRGYLLTKLINNQGKSVAVYEHEAVFSCAWGSWKSWRAYGMKMEIDHIDRNPKNNSIDNLRLMDRASQYTPDVLADMRKRTDLNINIARQIRIDYEYRTGGKVKFYKCQAEKYGTCARTIQNIILGVSYREKA